MVLKPEQYLQIAAAYEKAATDYTVPPQHRKAFARKAEMFRMQAQLGAKKVKTPGPMDAHIKAPTTSLSPRLFA